MPNVQLTGMSHDEIIRTFFDPDLKKASRTHVVVNENGVGIVDENGVEIVDETGSEVVNENGLGVVNENGSDIVNENGQEVVDAPENEWTQISEIRLFTKAIRFKPAGVNRRFNLGQLVKYMNAIYEDEEQADFELFLTPEDFKLYQRRTYLPNKREVIVFKPAYTIRPTPDMIMAKFREMYNMEIVERNESLPDGFKEQKDFESYMDSYEKDQTSSVTDSSMTTPVRPKGKKNKRQKTVKREVVTPPPRGRKRDVVVKREVVSPSPPPLPPIKKEVSPPPRGRKRGVVVKREVVSPSPPPLPTIKKEVSPPPRGRKRGVVVKREVVSPSPPPLPRIKKEVISPPPTPRSGSPTLFEIAENMKKDEKENKEKAMEKTLEQLSMEEKE